MAVLKKILLKNLNDSVKMDKEIEHVFLKAKRLQAQNRVYEEELQKFRSVGV